MKNLNEWLSTKTVKPMRHTGYPVESDTVLEIGAIVRIKDKEWFDSLNKDRIGNGIVKDGEVNLSVTTCMQKYLGEVVKITKVKFNQISKSPRYSVELEDRKDCNDLDIYVFCNEMLEYI